MRRKDHFVAGFLKFRPFFDLLAIFPTSFLLRFLLFTRVWVEADGGKTGLRNCGRVIDLPSLLTATLQDCLLICTTVIFLKIFHLKSP